MLLSTIPMFFVPEGGIRLPAPGEPGAAAAGDRSAARTGYSRKLIMFLLAMVLINFGRNSVAVTKAQYLVLEDGFDVSSRLLSHIVNMQSLAVFIFGLLMGWLSTRYRDDRILLWAAAVSTVGLLGFAFTGSLALVFVCNFLSGVAFVIIRSSSYAYASRLIPALSRGRQFALFNATFFLSWGTAGTLVTGPIVDLLVRSGSTQAYAYRVSFLAAAVLVMVGIVVLTLVSRMKNPKVEACARQLPR